MAEAEPRSPEVIQAESVPPPQPVIVIQQPPPNPWARKLSWLGWVGLAICLPVMMGLAMSRRDYLNTSEGLTEKFVSGNDLATPKIAVIDISGVIMDGEAQVKKQIRRIKQDNNVKAIVLRVNSPGGTVTGSDYIYHHLKQLREEKKIPLVVSMGGVAASGGYYVAMAVGDQTDVIFAEPTTTTGSIGVIIPHYDVSGLMERFDIKDDSLASHPRKKLLSMTQEMSADHKEVLGKYLDQAFERFKEVVRSGRPRFAEDEAALNLVATGEIFAAPRARELGLVDQLGFLEEAVERAAQLAGLDLKNTRVVRFEEPLTLLGALGVSTKSPGALHRENLWEVATPRAYYISTLLPWVASTYVAEGW